MKIITPVLEISQEKPFDEDLFSRKRFAEQLTSLVQNTSDPLVIGLDAKWGEGKTTFIKKWQILLDAEGIPNIYIDAFKNDHTDDAFMVVASAITDYTKEHAAKRVPALVEKVKKVGVGLLSWGAKIGIKAATLNIIKDTDIEELKEISSDLSTDFSSIAGALIEKKLLSHREELASIESFKLFLSSLSKDLDQNSDHPIIIIIDELDRCKPSFALEMLEKIKHLFSVENVVFVLVMNKEQLEDSIKTLYGINIDAHSYLQKFINIEAILPKRRGNYSDIKSYTSYLIKAHEFPEYAGNDLYTLFYFLAEHLNLSLRQLERSVTSLALAATVNTHIFQYNASWLAFCSIMKATQPRLLKDLYEGKISVDDLCKHLNLPSPYLEQQNDSELLYLLRNVQLATMTDAELKKLKPDSVLLKSKNQNTYSSEKIFFIELVESFLALTAR